MAVERRERTGAALGVVIMLLLSAAAYPAFADGPGRAGIDIRGPGGETAELGLRGYERLLEPPAGDLYRRPQAYLLFLPGPVFLVLLVLTRRRFEGKGLLLVLCALALVPVSGFETGSLARDGVEAFRAGRYEGALQDFLRAERLGLRGASLQYDIGLCHLARQRWGRGIARIRRAIRVSPQDAGIRDALERTEDALDLHSQIPPGIALHPNVPFVAILILFNTAVALFGVLYRFKRGGTFILSVLTILVLIGALGVFLYALHERGRPVAVVAEAGAALKRVPLSQAREWVLLPEGTTLDVRGRAQGYLLVRTGLGLEGWVESGRVLLD